MIPGLRLRRLEPADLAFADSLRAVVGWNQTLADWQRFLVMEPDGCFLAEWDGRPVGTATTTVHGPELAWIGMVLVHPDFRRRGVGRALLERCLDHLTSRRIRCIKLDATPLGMPVYAALGFQEEWALARWERPAELAKIPTLDTAPSPKWLAGAEEALAALDARAFGLSRRRLLAALGAQGPTRIATGPSGSPTGYGMARPGARAGYLGPVVASDKETGRSLVQSLLATLSGRSVFWDVPNPNAAAQSLAQTNGFTVQRTLVRMYLGENAQPGDPTLQFALTGPETG